MATSEEDRHRLHQRLDHVLGADEAAILMGHLPPTGWRDVTTNAALDAATARLTARTDQLEARLTAEVNRLDARIAADTRRLGDQVLALDKRVAHLASRVDGQGDRLDRVVEGQSAIRKDLSDQMRTIIITFVMCLATFSGVVFAAVRV